MFTLPIPLLFNLTEKPNKNALWKVKKENQSILFYIYLKL